MNERVVKYFCTAHLHRCKIEVEVCAQFLVAESGKVDQCGGIGIPVTPSSIFEQSQLERRRLGARMKGNQECRKDQDRYAHYFKEFTV